VLPLEPDIAVMMHNINDYAMLHHEGSYWNDHPGRSLLTTFSTRPVEPENRFLRLANLLIPRTVNFLGSIGRAAPEAAGDPQAARSWDVVPVLMTMPDRWPGDLANAPAALQKLIDEKVFAIDDYSDFIDGFDRMNETIRQTAARFDVPVIDLAARIPPSRDFMFDPIHFTESGSRLAAEVIGEELCLNLT